MKSTTIYKHAGTAALEADMGSAQASLDRFEFRNGRSKLCDFPSFGLRAVPYSDPDAKNLVAQKGGIDTYFAVKRDLCHIFSKEDYLQFMHYPSDGSQGMISYEAMRQAGYGGVVVHYDPITMQNDPLLKSWKGDAAMIWSQEDIIPVSKEIADLAKVAEAPDPNINEAQLTQWASEHLSEVQKYINNDVLKYYDMVYVLRDIDDIQNKLHFSTPDHMMDLSQPGICEIGRGAR